MVVMVWASVLEIIRLSHVVGHSLIVICTLDPGRCLVGMKASTAWGAEARVGEIDARRGDFPQLFSSCVKPPALV